VVYARISFRDQGLSSGRDAGALAPVHRPGRLSADLVRAGPLPVSLTTEGTACLVPLTIQVLCHALPDIAGERYPLRRTGGGGGGGGQ
jgi:hypothetical protein